MDEQEIQSKCIHELLLHAVLQMGMPHELAADILNHLPELLADDPEGTVLIGKAIINVQRETEEQDKKTYRSAGQMPEDIFDHYVKTQRMSPN